MIDEELKGLLDEMRQETAEVRRETAEMRQENAEMRQEMRRETAEMRQENAAAHEETRREVRKTADDLSKIAVASEATQDRLKLVTELVGLVNEKLDVIASSLDQKIDLSAAETQALIKSSYGALDRRVQKLEAAQHTVE